MNNKYMNNLRDSLYELMKENGWDVTQLSVQCGIPYHTMISFLNKKCENPTLKTLTTMEEFLGIPLAVLIGADKDLEIGQYRKTVSSVIKMLAPFATMKGGAAV